jgi:hypothetical protein
MTGGGNHSLDHAHRDARAQGSLSDEYTRPDGLVHPHHRDRAGNGENRPDHQFIELFSWTPPNT